jgi:hypothetical protein
MSSGDPVVKYGRTFPAGLDALTIEFIAFREGYTKESGGMGKAEHFKRIVQVLWGPGSPKHFVWHPWAIEGLEELCREEYVGLAGCGSSGKTDLSAMWAIVNYSCAPAWTLTFVTSTTLKDARLRIWGSILEYWRAAPGLPGVIVESAGQIRYDDGRGNNPFSDRVGIHLIAGEKKFEKEKIGKMIGMKQKRVFLIADELPELTEAILHAAYDNMSLNPYFQMVASGNPKSYYDPFGLFCEPAEGWGSITVDDKKWRTKRGVVVHFDALHSPNWLAQEDIYPIISVKKIQDALDNSDPNSVGFWRMFRGFWCPTGSEQNIYSEADMIRFKSGDKPIWGTEAPIKVSALDPGFTNGGDRSAVYLAFYGRDVDGRMVIWFYKRVILEEDVTKKDVPRNYQIVQKWKELCEKEDILPYHAAFDSTNIPFADIVAKEWDSKVLPVAFGGAPSDMRVSAFSDEVGTDKYCNRVSELWFAGHEFLRNFQLKGVDSELAKELTSRSYETRKAGDNLKMLVESKVDMKLRISKSPDLADAAMIVVDLCRTRLGAIPGGEAGMRYPANDRPREKRNWTQILTARSPKVPRLSIRGVLARKR